MPVWNDQPADNIIMAKIMSDRQCDGIIRQQEKMCEEAKLEGKLNKKRIKLLRKKQKDLRQKFIETNDFINECEQKEAELDEKMAAEMKIQKKFQNDIDDYLKRIEDLTEYHEKKLKPAIREMSVFEDVLQEVVDKMDIFKSKEDFLDRIEALCKIYFEFRLTIFEF